MLFVRDVGRGPALLVVHGGPDFDHGYFLPDLDRLADAYRLIYYDQRGRGRSALGVEPVDVTLASEIADLDDVRTQAGLARTAILGHSFGALLALEYALRHRDRVSHLVLMNPAPVSRADFLLLGAAHARDVETVAAKQALVATAAYQRGDPDAVTAYYRLHFRSTVRREEDLERLLRSLMREATSEGILKARAIEQRLYEETWLAADYDLLPQLADLDIPTLVIGGEHDFIPAPCAEHIAGAIPRARWLSLAGSGHFAYLDSPTDTRRAIDALFKGRDGP